MDKRKAVVDRQTVVEWLEAIDIEVSEKHLNGLFHAPLYLDCPDCPQNRDCCVTPEDPAFAEVRDGQLVTQAATGELGESAKRLAMLVQKAHQAIDVLIKKPSVNERVAFEELCRVYVQSADERQRYMGLQYMTAETHDLAKFVARLAGKFSPLTTLTRDEQRLCLWQAIQEIEFGNKWDDKMILDNLHKAGFVVSRRTNQ